MTNTRNSYNRDSDRGSLRYHSIEQNILIYVFKYYMYSKYIKYYLDIKFYFYLIYILSNYTNNSSKLSFIVISIDFKRMLCLFASSATGLHFLQYLISPLQLLTSIIFKLLTTWSHICVFDILIALELWDFEFVIFYIIDSSFFLFICAYHIILSCSYTIVYYIVRM